LPTDTKLSRREKTKLAHQLAIDEFQKWLEGHPKASRKAKAKQFDIFCDSAELKVLLDG